MAKTLMDIDNALDNLGVYDRLGCAQHALLHSIVRVLNGLRFPDSAIIANSTLQTKAGLKNRNFHRTRAELISFRIDELSSESWVIRYQENPNQLAGRYWINYAQLKINGNDTSASSEHQSNDTEASVVRHTNVNDASVVSQHNDTGIQKNAIFGNDHRKNRIDKIEENRKEKNNGVENDFSNEDQPSLSEDEIAIIILLNKQYGTTWNGGLGTKFYPTLKEIATYAYPEIVEAVNATQSSCKDNPPKMLKYLLTVLKNAKKEIANKPEPPYYQKLDYVDEPVAENKESPAKEALRKILAENRLGEIGGSV